MKSPPKSSFSVISIVPVDEALGLSSTYTSKNESGAPVDQVTTIGSVL